MIYFITTEQQHVAIIDYRNIKQLVVGHPMTTPDRKFLVAYVPDVDKFMIDFKPLVESGQLDAEQLDVLLKKANGSSFQNGAD